MQDAKENNAPSPLRRISEQAAGPHLGISVRTLQDWRVRGIGPAYSKLGKRVVYDVADLDMFLAAARVEPKAAAA